MVEQGELFSGPELTPGFPGSAELARSARLANRAALEATDVERALTWLLAEWSGLTVDETLYRGEYPAEQLNAASVRVTGEAADPSPDFRSFTIRLAGREAQRGTVLPGLFRALGKLPGYWQTLTGGNLSAPVTVAALTLKETGRIEPGTAAGRRVWTLAAELTARICTAPPRSGLSSQSLT